MKIGLVRLRSGVKYERPLEHILDSFYYLIDRWIKEGKHEFRYYNITFDGTKPTKDPEVLRDCDVIIIPSENEFHYQTPNYIHTLQLKRSNVEVDAVAKVIQNKDVIILSSDKGDTVELYRDKVFYGYKNMNLMRIDEDDFPYGVHSLKYYFIKDQMKSMLCQPNKDMDFIYWGTSKKKGVDGKNSGDMRHQVLFDIRTKINNIPHMDSWFIGKFDKIEADIKFMRSYKELIPQLMRGKYTLCFNWLNSTSPTARYTEAIACGIVPFVWENYDEHNMYGEIPCQRVSNVDDLLDIMTYEHANIFNEVETNYLKRLPTKDEQEKRFRYNLERHGIK